jgi:hypothetical protein
MTVFWLIISIVKLIILQKVNARCSYFIVVSMWGDILTGAAISHLDTAHFKSSFR